MSPFGFPPNTHFDSLYNISMLRLLSWRQQLLLIRSFPSESFKYAAGKPFFPPKHAIP